MLENSTLPENPVENTTQAVREGGDPVPDGLKGEQQGEEGDRNTGANRWPREETMALLKIRSDMDAAFRDISPKAPLWEQVSRKLAELGYDRSAKKCKEKFENIHKYYRRTKEGRSGKPNGKTYRFFEQLEALNPHPIPSSEGLPPIAAATTTTTTTITNLIPNNNNSSSNVVHVIQDAVPCSIRFPSNLAEYRSTSSATTSSSSKGSGEEGKKNKKRRRLTEFFEGLMREVIEKQETLQRKFMEVLEKCEQDRMTREQAWKTEELARIKRERELLAQERSIAAAKDEAVLAFLKKFAENNGTMLHLPEKTQVPIIPHDKDKEKDKGMQQDVNNGGSGVDMDMDMDKDKHQECGNVISVGNFVHMSSSRWPKDEVEALIQLRTQLDVQQQQQGNNVGSNKGPLWEEVSSAMKGLGYDRSAKRCKEKWENINKYFKRMKEKNKRKPEDSKTCPYYHHLEALYSKKPKNNNNKVDESGGSGNELKPEELLMHIMSSSGQDQEERQQQQQIESSSEDADREDNRDKNLQEGGDNEDGYHQMVENSPSIAIMG